MQAVGDITGNLAAFFWFTKSCGGITCTDKDSGLDVSGSFS